MRTLVLALLLILSAITLAGAEDVPSLFTATVSQRSGASLVALHDILPVSVSLDLVEPSSPYMRLSAGLPDTSVILLRTATEWRGPSDYTWRGKVEGYELSTAVITVSNGTMYGHIDLEGRVYDISPEGSGHIITRRDSANEEPVGDDAVVPPTGISASSFPTANAEDGSQIDVLVLYTQAMLTKFGSASAVNSRVQHLVDVANTGYSNSGITTQLRLVGTELYTSAGAAEGIATGTALVEVKGNSTANSLRETYKADLVSLLRVFQGSGGCGTAYVMDSETSTFDSYAFSVVEDGSVGSTFCHELSFAHELGHNMGCDHDRANAKDSNGNPTHGALPYSYGYGISGQFGTVMSYISPRISYFSNPNITYGGQPIGITGGASGNDNPTTSADNARSINNTRDTVANFRTSSNPSCSYVLTPASQSFSRAGGAGSITVTAGTGCSWVASEAATWITITSGGSGSGNGTIQYSVDANSTASSRSASITVGNKTFSVSQDAGCSYSISPASKSFTSSGGAGSVAVTAGTSCDWTATTSNSWITIDSGASGSANGSVSYTVAANSSTSSRTGSLTIAGKTHTVSQAGVGGTTCSYAVNPTSISKGFDGGTGSITVTTDAGCAWTATAGVSWITVTSGSSGSGSGAVGYSIAENTDAAPRTGQLYIGDIVVTFNQGGSGQCTYTVSPLAFTVASSASTGTIQVLTQKGCPWVAGPDFFSKAWLTVTSGKSGTGSGTVKFSALAYTGSSSRTGTLVVAEQSVPVIQVKSGCRYTISAASAAVGAAGGSKTVSVTTQTGCAWTVTSDSDWLVVTSGISGSGNGTVTYDVSANAGTTQRSGILTIGTGQTHAVTQEGAVQEPVMPLPGSMEILPPYAALADPVKNATAAFASPVAFGNIAAGGDTLRLQVGLYKFSGPADFYLFIMLSMAPDTLFMVVPGNGIQQYVDQLIPWQTNVTAEFDAALFGDIPRSLLPPGMYSVYLAATPAGSINSFYFWGSSFTIP